MTSTSTVTQRIVGPAELLQAVPYLLGFHPERSLVLVGLADGVLVVTARLDLADTSVAGVLHETVAVMARGGSTSVVAAVYDDESCLDLGDPHEQRGDLAAALDDATSAVDCYLTDVLLVLGRRWWSLSCDSAHCCPPEGQQVPTEPSSFMTAATVAGVVALPDRAALEQLLEPESEMARNRLGPAIDRHDSAGVSAVLDGRGESYTRAVKRALFAAARAADEPEWTQVVDDDVARFGSALREIAVRDSVWMAIDDGRIDGRPLWRALARQLPAPYDAPPLFLFGWASWRSGDGALAGIAADGAVASDPGYTAADLLLAALARGLDPRRMPRLRMPRPGHGRDRRAS